MSPWLGTSPLLLVCMVRFCHPPRAEQLEPAAVSTPTLFVPGSTVGVALAAFGLSAPLRHALLRAFECGEEDSADALAETPEAEVEEILGEMVVDDDDTRGPTRMEKGYVRSFFRKLKSHVCTTLAVPSPSPTLQAITVQVLDTSNRFEYRDVLDQAAKGCYTMLTPAELSGFKQRFLAHTGAPVEGDARPSDRQLSALAHWLRPQSDGRREAPFVEFAIWGPFDGRSAKLRQFHDHILTRDGSWQYRLLRGPSTFSQWEASWNSPPPASCWMWPNSASFNSIVQALSA